MTSEQQFWLIWIAVYIGCGTVGIAVSIVLESLGERKRKVTRAWYAVSLICLYGSAAMIAIIWGFWLWEQIQAIVAALN